MNVGTYHETFVCFLWAVVILGLAMYPFRQQRRATCRDANNE